METPRHDPVLRDISLVLKDGFPALAGDGNYEAAPERLRAAYATSWQQLDTYLFDEGSLWHLTDDPRERVSLMLTRLIAEDDATIQAYANFGFMGYWQRTSEETLMFKDILFDGQPEDKYADRLVEARLAEILADTELVIPYHNAARVLMNFTAALFMTRATMPDMQYTPDEVRGAIARILES